MGHCPHTLSTPSCHTVKPQEKNNKHRITAKKKKWPNTDIAMLIVLSYD